jgi:hypothetical protein
VAGKVLLAILANVALLAAFVFGVVGLIAGIAEQHAANNTYVVTLATPGDDCGANTVAFDASGNVLSCTTVGLPSTDSVASFPGFTDAQDQQITDLAQRLGADGGLSDAGLAQIQQQVDKIAATVPADKKPHYDEGVSVEPLWGAWLAVVGGVLLASSLVIFRLMIRRQRPRRRNRI